ncbi:hypothetical protein [Nocardia sp. NPDC051570]|uniref:hypothetical protein n=1 Tax=Nocardia sp. NPDC051570 TaxID=3364324 RepID=UPI0037A7977C
MGTTHIQKGRHRLGIPGRVHCVHLPAVAAALAEYRRPWLAALLSPARHSFATMRRRTLIPARWVPATAS